MSKLKDLTGQRFGRLVVLERAENRKRSDGKPRVFWRCQCDCGNIKDIASHVLVMNKTRSCGCLKVDMIQETCRKIPGINIVKTRIYSIWQHMIKRCYNPKSKVYKHYGGRGITVCDEWKNDSGSFYKWAINNGYKDDLSIERKDVNGNYCPYNCCWATDIEQANNKRNSHFITFNNKTQTMKRWSVDLGLNYDVIRHRLKRGWTIEKALTLPLKV